MSGVGGDGITNPAVRMNINFTDGSLAYTVQGVYVPQAITGISPNNLQPPVQFSGTATSPGIPGSGNNYWIGYITISGGVATVASVTGTTSMAALVLTLPAGAIQLWQQTIPFTGSTANQESQWAPLIFPWLAAVGPN